MKWVVPFYNNSDPFDYGYFNPVSLRCGDMIDVFFQKNQDLTSEDKYNFLSKLLQLGFSDFDCKSFSHINDLFVKDNYFHHLFKDNASYKISSNLPIEYHSFFKSICICFYNSMKESSDLIIKIKPDRFIGFILDHFYKSDKAADKFDIFQSSLPLLYCLHESLQKTDGDKQKMVLILSLSMLPSKELVACFSDGKKYKESFGVFDSLSIIRMLQCMIDHGESHDFKESVEYLLSTLKINLNNLFIDSMPSSLNNYPPAVSRRIFKRDILPVHFIFHQLFTELGPLKHATFYPYLSNDRFDDMSCVLDTLGFSNYNSLIYSLLSLHKQPFNFVLDDLFPIQLISNDIQQVLNQSFKDYVQKTFDKERQSEDDLDIEKVKVQLLTASLQL